MENVFDAEVFVHCLRRGDFDGRLTEEMEKLSRRELEQVASLMDDRKRIKDG
jgi:hypothetical protein